jgi:hypothetical protein
VRPAFAIGRLLWKKGDEEPRSTASAPTGVANIVQLGSGRRRRLQSGYVYAYAFIMLIGLTAALTWVIAAMSGFPILTVMLAIPTFAAVACLFARMPGPRAGSRWPRRSSIFALGICCGRTSRPGRRAAVAVRRACPPLFGGGFAWALGIDGISLLFDRAVGSS